jgi:isopenicillin-N epimerase
MGSFHSENVDDLMAKSDEEYQPPCLPFETNTSSSFSPPFSFPEAALYADTDADNHADTDTDTDHFLLDRQKWTFLNHGAFGAALKVGYQRAEQWRYHLERQPLRYFDRDLLPHLVYSARRLAEMCHAPRDATTIIPNVTYGLNTVLKGYARQYPNPSHIILWDTSYGSLKKMAHVYCEKVTEIPVSDYFDRWDNGDMKDPADIFVQALEDTLAGVDTTNALLVLDHTTSNTALNMPLESLSKLAKERNMLVMVDGAHGLLAQDVNLSALPHVDFYLTNGHKWMACPRGIGILYCPSPTFRDSILEQPACMSHGIGQGFQTRFLWDGCRDYAAALSVPAVLDYWQRRGLATTQQDIQTKLNSVVELLCDTWQSSTLAPMSVHAPMMALVKLPSHLQKTGSNATSDDAKRVQDFLFDQFIEVPIKCIRGTLYVRISCHVYNELEEYDQLGQALLKFKLPV